jgi:hypothetical protein
MTLKDARIDFVLDNGRSLTSIPCCDCSLIKHLAGFEVGLAFRLSILL